MTTPHQKPTAMPRSDGLFEPGSSTGAEAMAFAAKPTPASGTPRLRYAQRHQSEFRLVVLDQLLGPDHQARLVWDYVGQLDLTPLLQPIRAVAGAPGRDATDPRILLCLWLYATLEG